MKVNGRIILGMQLVGTLLFMSCSKLSEEGTGNVVPNNDAVPLQVNMALSASRIESKAIISELGSDAGKLGSVGVLVVKGASGGYASYTTTEADTYTKFEYSDADGVKWTGSKNIFLNNVDGTVFAWAPLGGDNLSETPTIEASALTVSNVKVLASQTFDAATNRNGCSQIDYLYGLLDNNATTNNHQTVNKTNPTAQLHMHHALAKVSFKIMKKDGDPAPDANDYVKKIVLTSANTKFIAKADGMTMSLVDGALASGTEVNELTFEAAATKATQVAAYNASYDGVTAQAYGLVAPVAEATEDLSIALTLGTNDAQTTNDRTYATGTKTPSTFEWEKGKEYIYTVRISDKALEVTSVTIVDFGDGGEVDLPVE